MKSKIMLPIGAALFLGLMAQGALAQACLPSGRAKFCPGGVLDMGAGGMGKWKTNASGQVIEVCFPKHDQGKGLDCRPPRGPKIVIPWLKK